MTSTLVPTSTTGVALECDAKGQIRRILHDDEGFPADLRLDKPLTQLAGSPARGRVLRFLTELQRRGFVQDWEIPVQGDAGSEPFFFTGIQVGETRLVVATRHNIAQADLFAELALTNNELVNQLRQTVKEREMQRREDSENLLQLTRLNNEVTNTQRELARKNVVLQRLLEERNEFLGMVAHDLRNPIGNIRNYIEFLIEEAGPNEDEQHKMVKERIHALSNFMLALVNDYLDLSAIDSGALTLHRAPIDPAELVESNVRMNSTLAAKKRITIRTEIVGTIPGILADDTKLDQVLNNLISNAVKFAPPGSQVVIRVQGDRNTVKFSVIDNGPGIPAAEIQKLFKVYGTTSVQATGGEKSTGLGLNISKRIVTGHGGRIWVESEEGQGAQFHFTVPVPEAEVVSDPSPDSLKGVRILIVDDDPIGTEVGIRLLTRMGAQVDALADGESALDALAEREWDVVLLDHHMPGLDGPETCRQLRALPVRQPKVIAVTGDQDPKTREACLAAGMDELIPKDAPIDTMRDILIRVVQEPADHGG